jgi:hypothetical protein
MSNTKDLGANLSTGKLAYPITLGTLSGPNSLTSPYCEGRLKLGLNNCHIWLNTPQFKIRKHK